MMSAFSCTGTFAQVFCALTASRYRKVDIFPSSRPERCQSPLLLPDSSPHITSTVSRIHCFSVTDHFYNKYPLSDLYCSNPVNESIRPPHVFKTICFETIFTKSEFHDKRHIPAASLISSGNLIESSVDSCTPNSAAGVPDGAPAGRSSALSVYSKVLPVSRSCSSTSVSIRMIAVSPLPGCCRSPWEPSSLPVHPDDGSPPGRRSLSLDFRSGETIVSAKALHLQLYSRFHSSPRRTYFSSAGIPSISASVRFPSTFVMIPMSFVSRYAFGKFIFHAFCRIEECKPPRRLQNTPLVGK